VNELVSRESGLLNTSQGGKVDMYQTDRYEGMIAGPVPELLGG